MAHPSRRICLLLLAAPLCACFPVPKRVGSLRLTPAAPGLSLVIVPTENTNNAIKYASDNDANHVGRALALAFTFRAAETEIMALRKEQPLNTLVELLRANFKSVVKVGSLNEAKAQGGDLIGVLDFYQDLPLKFEFKVGVVGVLAINETLLLLDSSGKELGKVSAAVQGDVRKATEEMRKKDWLATGPGPQPSFRLYVSLQDELMAKFQSALEGSEPLRRYARERGTGAPAAPAPRLAGSDADVPRYRAAEDPAKFALVVGIEDYQSAPPAEYAERDARAVREHLRALGYPERNIVLLTGAEAGKSGLQKYLGSWLPRNVGSDGRVFFFFAGHGAPDPKSGRAYLLPWDGDAAFLESTAIPLRALYESLAALKAKSVVVALDASFSGAGSRSLLAKGARPLVSSLDEGSLPAGLAVLSAASGGEAAGSEGAQRHGLFTYCLLSGLNERGAGASVRSLYDYLRPRVRDAARRDGREQSPLLSSAAAAEGFIP